MPEKEKNVLGFLLGSVFTICVILICVALVVKFLMFLFF
jgi:hypothetical protein